MKPATRNLLPLLLLLLGAPGTAALAQNNTVEVTCVDSSGKPLKDIIVNLQSVQTQALLSDKTDKKGTAEFKKVEDGIYRAWVRHEGYAPALHEYIDLGGEDSQSYQLTLEAGDSTEQFYFEDQAAIQRMSDLIMAGNEAYQNNDLAGAEAKLREALEIQPTSPDVLQNLAVIQLQQHKFEEAVETLKETAESLKIFVKIFANQPPSVSLEQRLKDVEKLIETMPLQRLSAEADDALKARDYDTAQVKYKEILAQDSSNPAVYYNLSLAQAHAGLTAEAKASVKKALELKPGDSGFESLLRQIEDIEAQGISLRAKEALESIEKLLQTKDYAAALEKCDAELPNIPDDLKWTVKLYAARAHAALEHPDEAIAAFREAEQLAPEKTDLKREVAQYLFDQKRVEEGVQTYRQALELESEPVAAELFKLGQTFSRQGNSDAAGYVYEKVIEADPSHAKAYYELGLHHYYDTKKYDQAKIMLEKFLEVGGASADPSDVENAKTVLQVMARTKKK